MRSKKSLLDRLFFGFISVVLSFAAMYVIMISIILLVLKITGGVIFFGHIFIVGWVALGVGMLAGAHLFDPIYNRLSKYSLRDIAVKIIRGKQDAVKESHILEIPEVDYKVKEVATNKRVNNQYSSSKNTKIKNPCVKGNFHSRSQHK